MTAGLRLTVVAYAVGVALACTVAAARGRQRTATITAALVMLQIGVALQAVIDIAAIAGRRHERVAVHVAYALSDNMVVG